MPIGNVVRTVRSDGRAILLASPPLGPIEDHTYAKQEHLGPARLIRVGRDGSIGQVVLRIRAGYSNSRTFSRYPGLAVRKNLAVVVAEGDGAAAIDLRTLAVHYHRVPFPPRPRQLAAFVSHEGTNNPSRDLDREAYWIDRRHVAVVGYDDWTSRRGDQTLAAGLRILDTHSWRVRFVDQRAFAARAYRGTVIVWGASPDGLRGYDWAGNLRFHVFTGELLAFSRLRGGEAYVAASHGRARPRTYAVAIPSGRTRLVR